jgi:hypothetical protein
MLQCDVQWRELTMILKLRMCATNRIINYAYGCRSIFSCLKFLPYFPSMRVHFTTTFLDSATCQCLACSTAHFGLALSLYDSRALCWTLATFSLSWSFTHSVGLHGRGISPSQGRYLHTGQHKHRINAHTDIHASSGIRTHDPSI